MRSITRRRGMCEWDEFAEAAPRLRALLAEGRSQLLAPFHLLSEPGLTGLEQRACSELWIRDRLAASLSECANLNFQFNRNAREKLRIGYLSSDFQDHATAYLLVETLESHDRERFEVHGYSYGVDDSRMMRPRLEHAFDSFQDVAAWSDREIAQTIHRDGIDILIDLKGYTRDARTGILLLHPAPIQVNYLGYPGTLGGDICDYIVTDHFMTPPASAAEYAESFAFMPHSYQPHGHHAAAGPRPDRVAAGLPATGFVFCSFNQTYKLTPEIFAVWCRLLAAVPGSVLWLLDSEQARGNLRNEALRRGISPGRLIFAPDLGQAEHLARLQLADLALDTAPCGGHTTASDALWAGVPVVTCPGDTFPSRVAGSLLHAIGLAELIVTDLDAYFQLAFALATDPDRFAAVGATLQRNVATCPLFDVARYTRALELLYDIMWQRYQVGSPRGAISATAAMGGVVGGST